jgi:pimeloyl-ACP methyl ester carboxylesterase
MQLTGGLSAVRFGGDDRSEQLIVFPGSSDALQAPDYLSMPRWRLGMFVNRYYGRYADRFRIWTIGRRRGLPENYSTREMAMDYARSIERDIGAAHVRGESLGGLIAQHLAADRPDLVRSLTLVASAFRLGDAGREMSASWAAWASDRDWRRLYREMTQCLYAGTGTGLSDGALNVLGSLVGIRPPEDPSDFLVSVRACVDHDTTDRLSAISAPTLVIGGDVDPLFPLEQLRQTADGISNARLHVIKGTAHGAYLVRPREFDDAVLAFLEGVVG